jgi:RHS repeat-associated protein
MVMPQRSITSGSYRYGFNGKENDNDVKGTGNQQDYGMRIYDPRIGRFLSVDPITAKYPELTPYQFASNRPIDGIDLDGLEYCPAIPKFTYANDRSFSDYVKAIDNGVIDIFNLVPTFWNSGVSSIQSLRKGTYGEDLRRDTKETWEGLKQGYKSFSSEPLKTITSPQALEFLVNAYVGAKITLPKVANKNLLYGPASSSPSIALGLDAIEINGVTTRILKEFSENTLSLNHKQWKAAFGDVASEQSFGEIFTKVTNDVVNKGGTIKFDVTGFRFADAALDVGKSIENAAAYTNWEFLQVLGNKKLLNATKFYEGGKPLPTAEVIKRFNDAKPK